jgi:hypothetical protein
VLRWSPAGGRGARTARGLRKPDIGLTGSRDFAGRICIHAGAPHALFRWDDSTPAVAHRNVGDGLALAVAAACARDGLPVSDVELWHDVGWSFIAKPDGRAFEIYYAPYGEWILLGIAPPRTPGFIARLAGANTLPTAPELTRLCSLIHRTLVDTLGVKEIRWMLGGPPERVSHVGTPDQLRWAEPGRTVFRRLAGLLVLALVLFGSAVLARIEWREHQLRLFCESVHARQHLSPDPLRAERQLNFARAFDRSRHTQTAQVREGLDCARRSMVIGMEPSGREATLQESAAPFIS